MADIPNSRDDSSRSAVLKRAYSVIEEQQARLRELERRVASRALADREPLAIVGASCRFPGAPGIDEFWQMLREGTDAVSEIPADRWNADEFFDRNPDAPGKAYTRHGGFISGIDRFDPAFFGISPREAVAMDPQQRLLLETTWEALDRAGQPRDRLAGSPTGVFIGITAAEYGRVSITPAGLARIDSYHITGNTLNAAAGRLSYTLGFKGPAIAVDTACSSSLVAVHLASRAIWDGDCEQAIAGGVHLMLTPAGHVGLSRARVLSRRGRCRTFDAAADGMVRGEGCGVILLRRLSDAVRDGDPIVAVVRGTAVNQDGPSSGLTVPNGPAQEEVIRAALRNAHVDPLQVSYIEAHGTATPLGDPIEIKALGNVVCRGRPAGDPLLVGSVKTNIGHLEAAAGIAGIIKLALALQHEELPPHLHFSTPSPEIPWADLALSVVTERRAWPRGSRPRIGGVSAFGFSGTNAHVILEEAPRTPAADIVPAPAYVFPLSARTEGALAAMVRACADHVAGHPDAPIDSVCWTAQIGRAAWAERVAVIARDRTELLARLSAVGRGELGEGIVRGRAGARPRAGFVYADGSFATMCEVTTTWRSWGVEPWAVAGHGAGRYAAAVAAGIVDATAAAEMLARGEWDAARLSARPRVRWVSDLLTSDAAETALRDQGCDVILAVGPDDRARLIADAAGLWALGVPLNWAAMAGARRPKKVVLPSYPWERQRYWMPGPEEAASSGSERSTDRSDVWTYRLEWQEKPLASASFSVSAIVDHVGPLLDRARVDPAGLRYFDALDILDARVPGYIMRALAVMGLDAAAAEACTVDALADRLNVVPVHRRLFARLLDVLSAEGCLERDGERSRFLPGAFERRSESMEALLAEYPEAALEAVMLDRCGQALPDVLRGRQDPLALLFPSDGTPSAADLYSDTGASRVMNALVARAVEAASLAASGRPLRVAEIGGGTGGTTAALLPLIVPAPAEYLFTDVSPAFLRQARDTFHTHSFLRTARLDIESDPGPQGIELGVYDIVIAANVLHATRDLRASVSHALSLLRPGGVLVLLEGTAPMPVIDVIFGLTPGWWRFEDHDVRPSHPLPPVDRWRSILRDAGCDDVEAIGSAAGDRSVLGRQAVLIARKAQIDTGADRGTWLVVGDGAGLGQSICGDLARRGHRAEHVTALAALGERMAQHAGAGPIRGLVDVRSLDAPPIAALSADAVERLAEELSAGVVDVMRPLVQRGRDDCAIHLITGGAIAVEGEPIEGVAQSPLWGIGKVLGLEHPELNARLVDVDAASPDAAAGLIVDGLLNGDGETQVAYRRGRRLVARLRPYDAPAVRPALEFSADGAYVITGGFGGLGLLLAEWLAAKGAGLVVLAGRHVPSPDAERRLREIEKHGATVIAQRADVSDPAQVAGMFAATRATGRRIAGVFHAAGVLDDGILVQMNRERFARVMRPKVQGAWNLHLATRDDRLDWFVLFSAATSMLGSAGQGNHAAANAFLDSFAQYRRGLGLPAVSINWGAWAQSGAASGAAVAERVRTKGLRMIEPERGFQILERLMRSDAACAGAFAVDWDRIPASMAGLPVLSDCVRAAGEPAIGGAAPSPTPAASAETDGDRIHAAPPVRRRHLIEQHVRDEVRHVLGVPEGSRIDMKQGFFDLGMDSLTSMELRARLQASLGVPLPATLAFDFPTPDALVAELARQFSSAGDVADELASRLAALRGGQIA